MTQPRRVSPRIPYDEAICLARIDGQGRLYGRGVDLSGSGLSLVSRESYPIGTEIESHLLLPHGPRPVAGRIVRVTAAPGGFELAISFSELKPATAAAIDELLAERSKHVLPAKLRIEGVDHQLRCEAQLDDQVVRLTATLPFLRLDGGVDVVLGEQGSVAAAGTIRKIAVDPATKDGIPRLSLDVALDDEPRTRTKRYGTSILGNPERVPEPSRDGLRLAKPSSVHAIRLPPTELPPPCGHPLPSVVVAPGLQRTVLQVESRPPRRRVHGTAEIVRRPDLAAWAAWRPAVAMAATSGPIPALPTERLDVLEAHVSSFRLWWLLVPLAAVLAAALVHFGR